ncbi:NAD(+)/NADH kinase [Chloroflexi bacterium TSY]|nr:NAD(+)/NADH kinase [Chloroflexi bacterium TSY]
MTTVGIIANPASGKDIRRLVAHGSVFDNDEKVSIVRRVLLGLDAIGVEQVWLMPDRFGIGLKALDGLKLKLDTALLEMHPRFDQEDSLRAAEMMVARGAGCLVTLGGDGTNRVVSKSSGHVPLMPISTGTNNVFPVMIEGTIAGLAAGLAARGLADGAISRAPRIEVLTEAGGEAEDIALVDAVVYAEHFIATRAIWEPAKIRDIILTRAEPGNIGLSAVGAHLLVEPLPSGHGLFLHVASGGQAVMAPIAPGLMRNVDVKECRILAPGEEIVLQYAEPSVLALDGERERSLNPDMATSIRINVDGPRVVDAQAAIAAAVQAGKFIDCSSPG